MSLTTCNIIWCSKICSSLMGKQKFINFDVEDTAFIHLSYSAFNTEVLVSLNMDFTRCDNLRSCHIIGDMGTLRWDLLEGTITKITRDNERVLMFNDPQDLSSTNIEMWSIGLIKIFLGLQMRMRRFP